MEIADAFATVPHAQEWKRCLRTPRPSEPLRRGQQRRSHHACETHRPSLPAAETLCSRGDRRPKKQSGPPQPHTHSRCASNAPPDRPGRSARPRPAEGRHRPCRAQPPVRATGASSCGRKTNTLARKRVEVSVCLLKQTPPQTVSLRGCLFLLFGSTLVVKIKKTQESTPIILKRITAMRRT